MRPLMELKGNWLYNEVFTPEPSDRVIVMHKGKEGRISPYSWTIIPQICTVSVLACMQPDIISVYGKAAAFH